MEYVLELGKCNIEPVLTSHGELAWHIADVPAVLQRISAHGLIVLGGDILDIEMQYTYDNWYHNVDRSLSKSLNVKSSFDAAQEYIQKYINRNGEGFFVVLVVH